MQIIKIFLLAFALIGTVQTDFAYAYIDPGTGSILLQVLIGAVVGGLAIGRLYWEKLKSVFLRLDSQSRQQKGPKS